MGDVQVSVIVPAYNSAETIERCLRSLQTQTFGGAFEVIVVDSSREDITSLMSGRFPSVRFLRHGERKFPGEARNAGIREAAGKLLAFLDADCIADPNWLEQIVEAHRSAHPVIAGAVTNANPESLVGWANYFCELCQWMPVAGCKEIPEAPTGCLSFKRSILSVPFLEGTLCEDTAFSWKLAERGVRPWFVPGIRVGHINVARFSQFIRNKLVHGWHFGAVRISQKRWGAARRFAYVLATPALPFLIFGRRMAHTARNRIYWKQFVAASPLVLIGLIAWSAGESFGYLFPRRPH